MKKLTLALAILATTSVFAQRVTEIKVEDFGSNYDEHSIHKLNPVEVLSKVEGNKECLYQEDDGNCGYWGVRDSIILKISGKAEANFGGHNKVILREETLKMDYRAAKTITQLSLKGVTKNEEGTLVYDNVAWAQWGGSIPFDFKIEIHNDLNNKSEEREFRIPVSDGKTYSFTVKYADAKWTVSEITSRSSSAEIKGELAETLFAQYSDRAQDTHAQGSLTCLRPSDKVDAECFIQKWEDVKKLETSLANSIFALAKMELDFFSAYVNFEVRCEKPSQWNELKETTCSVAKK